MKKVFLLALIFPIFLGSCISIKYTAFEVKEPATITFPPEIVNLILVDNISVPSYEGTDSLSFSDPETVTFDSAKIAFVEALYHQLDEAEYFGSVDIYPYEIRNDENYFQEQPLLKKQIMDISSEMEADAILSLDNFLVLSAVKDYYVYGMAVKELSVGLTAKLNVYTADGKTLSTPLFFNDTLYWSEESEYGYFQPLPSLKEAVESITQVASEAIAKQFTPYWSMQTRAYFSDKETESLLAANKWNEARTVWETAYENEKGDAKKARLAFNIALANEYLDDLDKAVEWMNKAEELLPGNQNATTKSQFILYKEILDRRQLSRAKLKAQIGE